MVDEVDTAVAFYVPMPGFEPDQRFDHAIAIPDHSDLGTHRCLPVDLSGQTDVRRRHGVPRG